jgi:hypothetical protein
MNRYLSKVHEIETSFKNVIMTRVPREDNAMVNFLALLRSGIDKEIEASNQQVQTLIEP